MSHEAGRAWQVAMMWILPGLIIWAVVAVAVFILPWGDRSSSLRLLARHEWRWATEHETFDVWIAAPEHGPTAQRGVAPWRLIRQGSEVRERRDREIEWLRVRQSHGEAWMPARSDLDGERIVVFDGLQVLMVPVPAGGRALGRIAP